MRIAIGTNYFKEYDRQTRARECLLKLKEKHSEVELYNICFNNEPPPQYVGINSLPVLKRCSQDLVHGKKRLPFANDMFAALADTGADYFILTNSDIIVHSRLIKYINEHNIKAMPCNRLDIYPIKTLQDNIIPHRWEIGGFDVFVFQTQWFKDNSYYFEDFIWGSVWYDHHYAGIMKLLTNDKIGNTFPPFLFHESHSKNWSFDDPESIYNRIQYKEGKYNKLSNRWDEYYETYLKPKRQQGFVLECDAEEQQKEIEFFSNSTV